MSEIKAYFRRDGKRWIESCSLCKSLYPLAEEDAAVLDNPPTVDAAVTRLARNVTLPMEDFSSFQDVPDRYIDMEL